jgi:hypothetical protein
LVLDARQAARVLEPPYVGVGEDGRESVEVVAVETADREPSRHDIAKRRSDCRVERSHRDRLPDRARSGESANRQHSLQGVMILQVSRNAGTARHRRCIDD